MACRCNAPDSQICDKEAEEGRDAVDPDGDGHLEHHERICSQQGAVYLTGLHTLCIELAKEGGEEPGANEGGDQVQPIQDREYRAGFHLDEGGGGAGSRAPRMCCAQCSRV